MHSGADPLANRVLGGQYRLLERVGSGGMSAVYLARDERDGGRMAIKTLRRDLAKDPVQRDRFLREARAVNRINHENIVTITDFGESEDGILFLAMEFVDGVSLFRAMADAPFAPARALHIARQVAAALARAHQMGVVHRDLKPDNVLLSHPNGSADVVKILDFGIAKIFDAPSLTGSQQIFGTPGYIAPEYIQSTHIDGRADLYSLGVILYEMVTGALPFDYEYPGDLMVKHVTEPPVAPCARLSAIRPDLDAFILRCLRKDPRERFRDAHHFLAELRRVEQALRNPVSSGEASPPSPSEVGATSLPTRELGRLSRVPSARAPRDPLPGSGHGVARRAPEPPGASNASGAAALDLPGEVEVSNWRRRVRDAIKGLEQAELLADPDVARNLESVERVLAQVEEASASCRRAQVRMEVLDAVGRDARSTSGGTMDALGRRLSDARGELERATRERDALRARQGVLPRGTEGAPGSNGEETPSWELASAEEAVRRARRRCDEVGAHVKQLDAQMAAEKERVEGERAHLAQTMEREAWRLRSLVSGLESRVAWLERRALHERAPERDTPEQLS